MKRYARIGILMTLKKNDWLFVLLWVNVAVATVILIRVITNQISSGRQLLLELGYSLVFANLTGVLGALVLGSLAVRAKARTALTVRFQFLIILGFSAVACLPAQLLLIAIGLIHPQHFWLEYLNTLRVALPLAGIFGLGAVIHSSLRERVRLTEEKLRKKELDEERARKLAIEARLCALESRIHPHFLFNTLNSISSLISVDPARAEQMVGRLAVLLRASLDSGNQSLIPLQQELAMVESYLEIEKVRFGDKLRGSTDVADEFQCAKVPPMSVQVLVENAVKHGISPQRGGGSIQIVASRKVDCMVIEVRDSGPGFNLTDIPAGHGLDNLVERLDALFGASARLNVCHRDGQCVVEMVLPRL